MEGEGCIPCQNITPVVTQHIYRYLFIYFILFCAPTCARYSSVQRFLHLRQTRWCWWCETCREMQSSHLAAKDIYLVPTLWNWITLSSIWTAYENVKLDERNYPLLSEGPAVQIGCHQGAKMPSFPSWMTALRAAAWKVPGSPVSARSKMAAKTCRNLADAVTRLAKAKNNV